MELLKAIGMSGKQGGTAEKFVPEAEASGIFYFIIAEPE
jgi:hypothetical protein